MNTPLITIGITCYSEGEWLRECWQSVLAQTDDRWTAVMVLDGTTHQPTIDIFEQIEHPRLRKYRMPENSGPYPTRNKAFELTETPYHFYLDGDDQLLPDSVATILRTFEQFPEAGMVYGDYQVFGSEDRILKWVASFNADDLAETHCVPGPCAYRIDVWEQLGGFSLELARGAADWDFAIGAFAAGVPMRHCGSVFYRYRMGHSSVHTSYTKRFHEVKEIMVRHHPQFFGNWRRRHRFLGTGYKISASANYAAGNKKLAYRYIRSALAHGILADVQIWSMILRTVLPARAFHQAQRAWKIGRPLRRYVQKAVKNDAG